MVPGITIETDVIVGFPGESEADFDMTLDMLESVRPDVTNVSRFTKRPHARASMMPQVDTATINERSSYAAKTVRKIQSEINSRFVGERMRILITEPGASSSVGRDSCYRHAVVTAKAMDAGATINAKVYSSSAYSIICAPD
jgi:tRNA A37 methylthiotransferase MiaB